MKLVLSALFAASEHDLKGFVVCKPEFGVDKAVFAGSPIITRKSVPTKFQKVEKDAKISTETFQSDTGMKLKIH